MQAADVGGRRLATDSEAQNFGFSLIISFIVLCQIRYRQNFAVCFVVHFAMDFD